MHLSLGTATPFAVLCTCYIGIIFVAPFTSVLSAVMYLAMSGQFETATAINEPMPVLTPLR